MKKILLPLACLAALALGGLELPAHASSSSSSISASSCARKHGKRKPRSGKKKTSAQTPVQL
jgi:hypothetical protein